MHNSHKIQIYNGGDGEDQIISYASFGGRYISFLGLSCQTVANNVTNFSVTWLKDGKAIPETSSRYHFSSDGSTSFEFGIKTCTAIDVGQYMARAIGQKGETNSAFALNVVNPGEL